MAATIVDYLYNNMYITLGFTPRVLPRERPIRNQNEILFYGYTEVSEIMHGYYSSTGMPILTTMKQ